MVGLGLGGVKGADTVTSVGVASCYTSRQNCLYSDPPGPTTSTLLSLCRSVCANRLVAAAEPALFTLSATKDNRMYPCTRRVDPGSVLVHRDWKQGIFPDTNEYRFY